MGIWLLFCFVVCYPIFSRRYFLAKLYVSKIEKVVSKDTEKSISFFGLLRKKNDSPSPIY